MILLLIMIMCNDLDDAYFQSMILMVLQLTCWISYSKHHINKTGLHNTKYQTRTKLGK